MKHSRFTKLFVLILSLALLIGSAVCVAASADEGADYGIKSVNIAHGDKIQVLIAVDAPNLDAAEAEQLTVTYTYNGETIEADYWKMMDIYKNGTLYPVFYTVGIAMKDIGESIVAQVGNGAPMDISVADYLYTKLAKEGFAFATEGEDAGRKNLYLTLLNYGAQAQEVLWNNKHPEAPRTLVTSVIPVYAANGVTVDGQSGLLKLSLAEAGRVDIAYTGAGILDGYKITDANGVRYVSAGSTAAYVNGITKIEPVYLNVEATVYDFEGEYTNNDEAVLNELTFADGVVVTSGGGDNRNSNQLASVVYEEGRGNYLNMYSDPRVDNNRSHGAILPKAEVLSENPNVTVLQFDIKDRSNNWYDTEFLCMGPYIYLGRNIAKNDSERISLGYDEWNTVRLEAYIDLGVLQVYINGVYSGSFTGLNFSSPDTAAFWTYNNSQIVDISLDNIYFFQTTKEYVAVPAATPVVETFDAGWEYGVFSGACASTPELNQEVKAADGLIYSKMDGDSRTNQGKTYSAIVNDGVNSYLRSYSPGRNNLEGTYTGSNRSHSMFFTPEKLVADAIINTTVLEFDIKVEGLCSNTEGLVFAFTAADGKYLRFYCNNSLNFIKSGHKYATINVWTRVKFVVDYAAKSISLYSNGEYVGELNYDNADLATMNAAWSSVAGSAFASAQIYTYNGNGNCIFNIDNFAFYHTYTAPAAE